MIEKIYQIKYIGKSRAEIIAEMNKTTFECAICMSPRNKGLSVRYYFKSGRSSLLCLECASAVEKLKSTQKVEVIT